MTGPAAGGALGGALKDKRVLLAAGAVGVVGLVVLLKRGGGGGLTGDTIQPANLDTTGGDLYNALQALGAGWSNDLRGFTDQLQDLNDKLTPGPAAGTGADPRQAAWEHMLARPPATATSSWRSRSGPVSGGVVPGGSRVPSSSTTRGIPRKY